MNLIKGNNIINTVIKVNKERTSEDNELIRSLTSLIDGTLGANFTKFPEGMTEIGDYAFYNMKDLALQEIPETVTKIGTSAFNTCTNWANEIALHDGIKEIGSQAFTNNTNLVITKLPRKLKKIGYYSFYKNEKIAIKEIPEKVHTIDSSAFYGNTNLSIKQLPSTLTSLNSSAFYGCTNLAITALQKDSYIQSEILRGCTKLELLDIKGAVRYVRSRAFYGCTNLSMIVFSGITAVPSLDNTNVFANTPIADGTGYMYFPDDLLESIKAATNWSVYADQMKPLSEAPLYSIEMEYSTDSINLLYGIMTFQINKITYNNGNDVPNREEEKGYVFSIEGKATIDQNGLVTINDNAQDGDVLRVTVTSTYDSRIQFTKNFYIYNRVPTYSIDLKEGQWIDSGTTVDGNTVYQSDAGTHGINAASIASVSTIKVDGCKTLKIYIRNNGAETYTWTMTGYVDVPFAGNGNSEYRVYTDYFEDTGIEWKECIYELDCDTHTIDITYYKYNRGTVENDDRGYFYIGECS